MFRRLPFALELEVRRVDMLFRQNLHGPFIMVVASIIYLIPAWNVMPHSILFGILGFVSAVSSLRLLATWRWFRTKATIFTFAELYKWNAFMIVGCTATGVATGAMAAAIPVYFNPLQQFYLSAMIFAMASGSIAAYVQSLYCGVGVLFPAMLAWMVSIMIVGGEQRWPLVTVIVLYSLVSTRLARNKYFDFERSLRVNLDLHQSEEKLRIALDSSGAISWEWNPTSGDFTCNSSLERLLQIESSKVHSLDDYLNHVHPDDRESLRSAFENVEKDGIIDTDHRILLADGSIRYVAVRGQAQLDKNKTVLQVAGIFWDITSKRLEEQRRFERDLGETADKAKLLFLANVSHEIRTPLTAINGFAETTLRDSNLSQRARDHLRIILRSGKYLTSVVHDLLDLSKAETGNIFIQKTRVSLNQEIVDSLNVVQRSIARKGLKLDVIYETPIPESILSDPTRLRQILINLLSNAVKYTDKGSILVKASFEFVSRTSNGRVRLVVTDTGMGISDAQRNRLFQPFTRGEDPNVRRRQGSGLGLALARSLAIRMGGDLNLISSASGPVGAKNTGSTFELLIDTGPIGGVQFVVDHPQMSLPEAISLAGAHLRLEGKSLLLVEDDEDIRWLLQDFLVQEGAKVAMCANGQEALKQAFMSHYDAIIMDINMPVMDGYTATTILRQRGFRNFIVALTAHASSNDELLCYQAGCDCYLSKPIDFAYLIEVLTEKPPVNELAEVRSIDPAL